jgi:hypothetical protein
MRLTPALAGNNPTALDVLLLDRLDVLELERLLVLELDADDVLDELWLDRLDVLDDDRLLADEIELSLESEDVLLLDSELAVLVLDELRDD